MKAVEQSRNNGSNRAFVAETLADGSAAHSFARVVGESPVTGSYSVAIAVLSVTEPDESTTYADIARALAADYYNIYVIDLDTDEYTEYSSQVGGEELQKERKDVDFFASARRETMTRIYEDDREGFLKLFTRENVLRELDAQSVFTTSYRLIDTGTPMYVNMKITRMRGGNRIRDACKTICDTFKHSPVFRVGGDEFTVIAQDQDYAQLEQLMGEIDRRNEEALRSGGLVIACGMARFEQETCVAAVFERADHRMYSKQVLSAIPGIMNCLKPVRTA